MAHKIPAFCVSSSSLVAARLGKRSVTDTETGPTPPTNHHRNMVLKKAKLDISGLLGYKEDVSSEDRS